MGFPAFPTRNLTAEELKRYDEDGVIMIKGAIDGMTCCTGTWSPAMS